MKVPFLNPTGLKNCHLAFTVVCVLRYYVLRYKLPSYDTSSLGIGRGEEKCIASATTAARRDGYDATVYLVRPSSSTALLPGFQTRTHGEHAGVSRVVTERDRERMGSSRGGDDDTAGVEKVIPAAAASSRDEPPPPPPPRPRPPRPPPLLLNLRARLSSEARELLSIALPIVGTNLLGFTMNVVDLAMVGQLGKKELAAAALGECDDSTRPMFRAAQNISYRVGQPYY